VDNIFIFIKIKKYWLVTQTLNWQGFQAEGAKIRYSKGFQGHTCI